MHTRGHTHAHSALRYRREHLRVGSGVRDPTQQRTNMHAHTQHTQHTQHTHTSLSCLSQDRAEASVRGWLSSGKEDSTKSQHAIQQLHTNFWYWMPKVFRARPVPGANHPKRTDSTSRPRGSGGAAASAAAAAGAGAAVTTYRTCEWIQNQRLSGSTSRAVKIHCGL